MELQNLLFSLTLFDGEGATDSGANMTVENNPVSDQQESGGVGENANQEGSDAGAKTSNVEDKKARFKELIDGEFREEYREKFREDFQPAFDRRHKNVQQTQEQLNQANEIMDLLRIRYKGTTDASSIKAALENDNGFWDAAAEDHGSGMEGQQYRTLETLRMEKENRERADAMRIQRESWMREAESVKGIYPNFELENEIQNDGFKRLVRSGVPMQHAYEVCHLGEIKSTTAKAAAEQAERKTIETVRAKGTRPVENGASSQGGIVTKGGVSNMTDAQIEDLARRAKRGEKIAL